MSDFDFEHGEPILFDEDLEDAPAEKTVTESELKQMKLLDKLELLIDVTKGCHLKDEFFNHNKPLIQSVADDLQLTPGQAVLFCPFVDTAGNSMDFCDLQRYFRCSSVAIMKRKDDLQELLHRRYVCACGGFRRARNRNYRLSDKAQSCLCDNKGLPIVKTKDLSPVEFMRAFCTLIYESDKLNQIDEDELIQETMELMRNNPQLEIAKAIERLKVADQDKFVMLRFCKELVVDGEEALPLNLFEDCIEDFYGFVDTIVHGVHPFTKQELLAPANNRSLFNRDVYSLTPKARRLFLKEYNLPKREMRQQNIANATLIKSKDITPKVLFYSPEDQGQIDTLQGLLTDKQLKEIRKRLESANMRKGFNCLFYGTPGTGKTETALQLARSTGRDIMQVDISSMRDKWYGETEKIVKGIFESYANLVKLSKRIPILLINEADALLSVRTSIGSANSSIEKTENAIQNILLEAMENIDGIMIATTNLTCNLDPAFDRRFLYKVEFHQPGVEAKTHIWEAFLPDLSNDQALILAKSFDFSGGQIENIARKVMVDHLLFGGVPDMEHLKALCANEQLAGCGRTSLKPIGFH